MYPNTAYYMKIHPGLIKMTKKFSYYQTEKLGSPDLKVGKLFHHNFYDMYSTSWWFSTTLCIQKQLIKSRFILVWLEWRRSWHIPTQKNWDHLIWKCDNFFILTPMKFIQFLSYSPLLFMYPITASYIAIYPGYIRMTKKLSYSQTGKHGSPDLKVG